MHIKKIFIIILLSLTLYPPLLFSMAKPESQSENTLNLPIDDDESILGNLFHYAEKRRDPLSYISDEKAIAYCNCALQFHPDHSKHVPYKNDTNCLKVIDKIIARMMVCLEQIKKLPDEKQTDSPTLERIIKAKEKMPSFFSASANAIIEGFRLTKSKEHRNTLKQLDHFTKDTPPSDKGVAQITKESSDASPSETTHKAKKLDLLSIPALQKLVLEDNPTLYDKSMNWISKTWYSPLSYLSEDKSHQVCAAILLFNPAHPEHTQDWGLNADLPWHRQLVINVVDREKIYLTNLAHYFKKDNHNQIMQLSPKTKLSDEKNACSIPESIFSDVSRALCAGYLQYAKNMQEKKNPEPNSTSNPPQK